MKEVKVREVKKYSINGILLEMCGESCFICDVDDDVIELDPEEAKKMAYYILQYYGPAK